MLLDCAKRCGGVDVLVSLVEGVNMKSLTANIERLRKSQLVHSFQNMTPQAKQREETSKWLFAKIDAAGGPAELLNALGDFDPGLLGYAVQLAKAAEMTEESVQRLIDLFRLIRSEAGISGTTTLLRRLSGHINTFIKTTQGCNMHLIEMGIT